jgi:Zn-finger in ubiquitin-hydrolases and other protein
MVPVAKPARPLQHVRRSTNRGPATLATDGDDARTTESYRVHAIGALRSGAVRWLLAGEMGSVSWPRWRRRVNTWRRCVPIWGPVQYPVCEDCARAGKRDWVSLRRCLTCGHVGRCDSSPDHHATEHYRETAHPAVQTLQPRQDWVCCVDALTMGRGRPVLRGRSRIHARPPAGRRGAGDRRAIHVRQGLPAGMVVAEMRRRKAAGELTTTRSRRSTSPRRALGRLIPGPGNRRSASGPNGCPSCTSGAIAATRRSAACRSSSTPSDRTDS